MEHYTAPVRTVQRLAGRRYNGINHPDEYSQVFGEWGLGTMVLGAAAVLKRVGASEGVVYPVIQNKCQY